MAKRIHKTKKTPLFKNVGFYFVLLYALLTLGMILSSGTLYQSHASDRYITTYNDGASIWNDCMCHIIITAFRNVLSPVWEKSK